MGEVRVFGEVFGGEILGDFAVGVVILGIDNAAGGVDNGGAVAGKVILIAGNSLLAGGGGGNALDNLVENVIGERGFPAKRYVAVGLEAGAGTAEPLEYFPTGAVIAVFIAL